MNIESDTVTYGQNAPATVLIPSSMVDSLNVPGVTGLTAALPAASSSAA